MRWRIYPPFACLVVEPHSGSVERYVFDICFDLRPLRQFARLISSVEAAQIDARSGLGLEEK